MIIVSQDRNEIINFENVERIDVTTATNPVCFNINYETNGTRDLLGQYSTEERAKEILEEIVTLFKNEEILHITKSALNNLDEIEEPKYILKPVCRAKVYYMPKE